MGLISPADQDRLRETFAVMTRPVRLLFFTQALGCEACPQTRQILDELPPLSDKITVEEVNFILDKDKATAYAIDRVPAIAVAYEDDGAVPPGDAAASAAALKDSRIRFLGTPAGYEFLSLVHAVRLAGGGQSTLSDASLARLATVSQPVTMQVFTTPT